MKVPGRWNVCVHYERWQDNADDYVRFQIDALSELAAWHAGLTEAYQRTPTGKQMMSLHVSPYYEEGGEEGLRMVRCSYVFPVVEVKDETAH